MSKYSIHKRSDVALILAAHRAFGVRGGAYAIGVSERTMHRKLVAIRKMWSPL